MVAASLVRAAEIPMTIISEDEADPIHSAIIRKEAWTADSVRRLRAAAEKKLREGPWSVTTDRPADPKIDPHEYYSEAPYWWPDPTKPGGPYVRRDGQFNPARFTANKEALNAMCDAVFTLGTAAFLLDDTRYGKRAARDIAVWFINPRTRMNPNLEDSQAIPGVSPGRGAGVIDGRAFIRAIQGMEFLAQTGAWDPREQAAVTKWFQDYLRWLTTSQNALEEKVSGNNHASWWTAQTAAVATFVGDKLTEEMAFKYYRERIFPRQVLANGSAPREEARTRSLWYSAFNLEAFTMTCRIAEVRGVNLWNVKAKGGATIAKVIDYLQPYFADPRTWRKQQISDFSNDNLYCLAFAGMGLKRPDYIALYRKWERPEGAWLSLVDLMIGRWEAAGHQTRH